jgi:NADH:ubiquinone oxidoreductase subunit C
MRKPTAKKQVKEVNLTEEELSFKMACNLCGFDMLPENAKLFYRIADLAKKKKLDVSIRDISKIQSQINDETKKQTK